MCSKEKLLQLGNIEATYMTYHRQRNLFVETNEPFLTVDLTTVSLQVK